ncbi:septin-8-like isoform X3, partial [Clarias magur]
MAHSLHSDFRNEDLYTSVEERLNEINRNSRQIKGLIKRCIINTRTVIDDERLKRVVFRKRDNSKPHKTILLVGETGSGKSTLINAMVNYMLGVRSDDRIWCEIIETTENQTGSKTNVVTVYDVFTEHCPFSLTVIDTPGFGSTEGIEKDVQIAESLLELFRLKEGVHEIDAVCLVVTSVTVRLTDRQRYVFNAVLSLFGYDVEKNIVVFITHASRKPNNAIKAIKESKIPCARTDNGEPVYFRFDSFHCEDLNDEETLEDYESAWTLLNKAMGSFLTFLNKSNPISTKMTEAVLRNRKQLTASIFNMKDRITLAELKQNELKQIKEALQQLEKNTGFVDDFQIEVIEAYKEKVPIDYQWWHFGWKEATCCTRCEENCHYPGCWWVKDLSWCSVMQKGNCTVCTRRCRFTEHVKERKMYETKTRTVKKTNEDLKRKYETEAGDKKSLIIRLENEITKMDEEKVRLVDECYRCVVMLEGIALASDSVYTLLYLDFLIEKVKETGNTDRVMPSSACDSLVDDIEDMVSSSEPAPLQRSSARHAVVPRVRKRKDLAANEELQVDSVIPGTQKVWVRTWGCSHNSSDGEYMAGQLAASGYKITADASDADVWLLNSCTVKSPAEDHFRNNIKKAQEQNKKVVVAGCVPQAQPRMDYLKGLSIIGVQQIDRVVEVVDEAVK